MRHFWEYLTLFCFYMNCLALLSLKHIHKSRLPLILYMLGNFSCFFFCLFCFFVVYGLFFKLTFSKKKKKKKKKKTFQEYHQGVKQFGFRSGPTFCRSWSWSKLFAKVISRRQKSPLAGKDVVLQGFKRNSDSDSYRTHTKNVST